MEKELQGDITNDRINHAYFLECSDEEKGLKEAKEFSERLLNGKLDNNPDFKIIETNEKIIKVEEIRELQKEIQKKPITGDKKVYIIYQANKLNIAAQNCLLKTLEEPPEYLTLILVAPSIYSVISTVRSRVKTMKISSNEAVVVKKEIVEFLDTLKYKNKVEVLKYANFFEEHKDDILEILHEMMVYCDKKILENKLSDGYNCDTITFAKYISIIDATERKLLNSSNFSMAIDKMLLDMRG